MPPICLFVDFEALVRGDGEVELELEDEVEADVDGLEGRRKRRRKSRTHHILVIRKCHGHISISLVVNKTSQFKLHPLARQFLPCEDIEALMLLTLRGISVTTFA